MENIKSTSHTAVKNTDSVRKDRFYQLLKRMTDVGISLVLLLTLMPLLLFISYRIYKKEGKPIFYKEVRVGKNGREFIMFSFRIMTNPSKVIWAFPPHPFPDSWMDGVPDEFTFQRDVHCTITPTGKWLKKYHLHKLPRLWNVLKGDMSLVGPKPEKKEIVDYYNDWQKNRLKVKPGITGYARAVRGDNMNYTERVNYDLYYIHNRSVKMDMKILWNTIKK
ncbi:sugar transferase [Oceanobacillus salinisoli]|uniref:sugar transferase n=1 Tax=Oceanobacillus salinisoli TaxID=2678611 RepID=UPI0012E10B53|nr:sugar transferase [Oceanobacillus salinisoli]